MGIVGHLQESKGLSLGNSQKSLKRGSWGLSAPGSKKARKRVENDYFSSFFFGFLARFRLVFDFFGGYVDPGAESPRQPLFRLFSEFSREKAFDSCRWPTISQVQTCESACTLEPPKPRKIQSSSKVTKNPEGPARHLDVSGQKSSPHCLEKILDSQLPSPKSSPKMPPKLFLPHRRGHSFLFQNYPCGEGNCEAIERQKLSRGNFCPGTSRCLAGPTGEVTFGVPPKVTLKVTCHFWTGK